MEEGRPDVQAGRWQMDPAGEFSLYFLLWKEVRPQADEFVRLISCGLSRREEMEGGDREWKVGDGGWSMEDGGWRMEDGGWRIEDGG